MRGQWIGQLSGETPGSVCVNIDDRGSYYSGNAFFSPQEQGVPSTFARFKTTNKANQQYVEGARIEPCHPFLFRALFENELNEFFPGAVHSATANLHFEVVDNGLAASFSTSLPTSASGVLSPSMSDTPSALVADPNITGWHSFKEALAGIEPYRFMFRGQSSRKRLRTAFHRTGRSDLARYVEEDVLVLQQAISARVSRFLTLGSALDAGAFYNLVQHHGFPTPVLDWTYSPFIAAFFSYRYRLTGDDEKVRIFMLDKKRWDELNGVPMAGGLTYSAPHVSVIELPAIENDRAIPQQALQTVTNIDDIEGYIRYIEGKFGENLLRVIDLPRSERPSAMDELVLMGITAGSLFPGLDGTCEQMKSRLFGYDV